jgi:hypothetical protein
MRHVHYNVSLRQRLQDDASEAKGSCLCLFTWKPQVGSKKLGPILGKQGQGQVFTTKLTLQYFVNHNI